MAKVELERLSEKSLRVPKVGPHEAKTEHIWTLFSPFWPLAPAPQIPSRLFKTVSPRTPLDRASCDAPGFRGWHHRDRGKRAGGGTDARGSEAGGTRSGAPGTHEGPRRLQASVRESSDSGKARLRRRAPCAQSRRFTRAPLRQGRCGGDARAGLPGGTPRRACDALRPEAGARRPRSRERVA